MTAGCVRATSASCTTTVTSRSPAASRTWSSAAVRTSTPARLRSSDAKYGEELCAWIRMKDGATPLTAESLREFCIGQLAHYKIPRYVEIVEEFPMTVTGKIRKVEMRQVTAEKLGLV